MTETNNINKKEAPAFMGVITGGVGIGLTISFVILSNSIALIADMLNTVLEFLAILISWLTLRAVKRHHTESFNYGFGKLENISSLGVSGFMLISIEIIGYMTYLRFRDPVVIQGFGVIMGMICHAIFSGINGFLIWKTQKINKKLPSPIIDAQLRLFAVKLTSNICMFTALILCILFKGKTWALYIDPSASVFIVMVMLYNTYCIMKQSIRDLMDRSLDESLQIVINKNLAQYFDEYIAFNGVRSRYSGDKIFIEIFLEFGPNRKMGEVQEVINRMKLSLEENISRSQVIIIPSTKSI